MKKIAILADFPLFAITGNEEDRPAGTYATWLPQLAKALEGQEEFDITWIVIDGHLSKTKTLNAWNQTFHYLPRWKKSLAIFTAYWSDRRKIARKLKAMKPDLVHAWGSEGAYGLALVDHKSSRGLLSIQGVLTQCCKVVKQPLLMRIQARYEAHILRDLKYISCESDWGIEMVKLYAPNAHFERVEYGVNPEFFDVSRSPEEERLAIYVGGVNRLKGSDTLLSAFQDERLRGVSLKILGATVESIGEANCPPNVEFLGRLPVDQVKYWMSKAWCLVHPTRADTSPNCVKEARVVGLPVVTTPNGGQVQYVEHTNSGWIHTSGDVEGLIEGILEVTKELNTSLKMGAYQQSICRERLKPEKTSSQFLEIYKKMCE